MELVITDYSHEGLGLGKVNNFVIFLDGGVLGDRVRVEITKKKKRFAQGKILETLSKSAHRVKSPCPYSDRCGGCDFQNLKYKQELKWKEDRIRQQIKRLGDLNPEVLPILPSPETSHERNHMQFHVKDRQVGLYGKHSRRLVKIDHCLKQSQAANEVLKKFQGQKILDQLKMIGIRTNEDGERMLIFVTPKKLSDREVGELLAIALDLNPVSIYESVQPKNYSHYGREFHHLYGKTHLDQEFLELQLEISPQSFFQVNRHQAENMVRAIGDIFTKEDRVIELFSGIGTMSLPLANYVREIIGIEIVPSAVEDACLNARKNDIQNARYICGDVLEMLPKLVEDEGEIHGIIMDPPRSGIDEEVLDMVLKCNPKHIVYISCSPSTLARDLGKLANDYEIQSVQPVDMFSRTAHVESIILMTYCGDDKK